MQNLFQVWKGPSHDRSAVPSSANGFASFWKLLCPALGTVLVLAAVLKLWGLLVDNPVAPAAWNQRPPVAAGVIVLELAIGGWLISGPISSAAWWTALATFLCFFLVAVREAISGARSCGCFGPVQVSPWHTAGFDLVAVGLILVCYRARGAFLRQRRHTWLRRAALLIVVISGLAFGVWVVHRPETARSEDGVTWSGTIAVLEPEKWIDKTFPLVTSIDIGSKLQDGHWLVLLHRHDCSDCRTLLPAFLELTSSEHLGSPRFSLIEVPPLGPSHPVPAMIESGKLDPSHEWFCRTPLIVELSDGRVERVESGDGAAKWVQELREARPAPSGP